MRNPESVENSSRILGMVHYQLKFVDHMVESPKPLRDLLKEDEEFLRTAVHEETWALAFFEPNKQARVSGDSL